MYVRVGLGVGIVANMSFDGREDRDLVSIDASHLFSRHTTWAGFARNTLVSGFTFDFLELLAPHPVTPQGVRPARKSHARRS
jgi:LysR family cys regulon transcriptional activator